MLTALRLRLSSPIFLLLWLALTACGDGNSPDNQANQNNGVNSLEETSPNLNPEVDITPPSAITDLSQSLFTLHWSAPGDDANTGTAASYDIRYSTEVITEANWSSATVLSGTPAPQAAGAAEEFIVPGLFADTNYYFAIKTIDEAGNESTLSNLAIATPATESIYYVSADGDAAWPNCTDVNTPCSGKTAVENAVAGETVYFRAGTYYPHDDPVQEWIDTPDQFKGERLPWNPANIGTEGNPITFKAYPGETPVIVDNIYGGAFGVYNRSWIVWDGFTSTIVDSPDNVIQLVVFEQASHCVIRNSHLIGVRKGTHHNSALIFLNYSNDILIENNRIHGMNTYEPGDGPDYIETAVNASGILNFYTYNMTIKNNDIYDNYLGIFDKDTEQNNVYLNNHIWGTNSPSQGCNTGIQINDQLSEYGEVSGTLAHNNLIRNCDIAISLYDGVGLLDGVSVYNNTIVDSDSNNETGIIVTDKARSASVYNNIIYGYQSMVRYYNNLADNLLATTISLSDHNIFYNSAASQWHHDWITTYNSLTDWNMATTFDANSSTDDPLFINAGSADPDDYKLTAGSPAIGAGQGGATIGAFPDGSDLVIGYRP
ncbi:MAG: right-handed parallel beta-helix repeat-containing protein [Gammaproteobacteria bacterium]|nr:right-handed parallel beta-helix repeat-containing protein [Gammaproteobacteria bacterium]